MCATSAILCLFERLPGWLISVITNGPPSARRLDGSKSIAQHFGHTSRTVQRWHSELGLPVHRLGGKKSPVFAFVSASGYWIRNRSRAVTDEHIEATRPQLQHTPPQIEVSSRPSAVFDCSLISGATKARSAEFEALAYKVWGTLSNSNLNLGRWAFPRGHRFGSWKCSGACGPVQCAYRRRPLGQSERFGRLHLR